jgi:hypothetical protein
MFCVMVKIICWQTPYSVMEQTKISVDQRDAMIITGSDDIIIIC